MSSTPQPPVRAVTLENRSLMTNGGGGGNTPATWTAPLNTTVDKDIFSPRSAAAIALSTISRENAVPANLQSSAAASAASVATGMVSETNSCRSVSPTNTNTRTTTVDTKAGLPSATAKTTTATSSTTPKHALGPAFSAAVPDPLLGSVQQARSHANVSANVNTNTQPHAANGPHFLFAGYPPPRVGGWGPAVSQSQALPPGAWTPQHQQHMARGFLPRPHMFLTAAQMQQQQQQIQQFRHSSHKKAGRNLPPHSMVTPTPNKKARTAVNTKSSSSSKTPNANNSNEQYSRKTKSLGVLAQTFCAQYEHLPAGSEVIIDQLAARLGVERRRIYDVVNIFESLKLVVKKAKNTYAWMGQAHLPAQFGILQHEAVFDYPAAALEQGLIAEALDGTTVALGRAKFRDPKKDNKSLTRLSQQFLQLFLVGNGTVSLPEASDKIHGKPVEAENAVAAARSLKTKIRRLYDIANVFLAVGFLRKLDDKDEPGATTTQHQQRRPCFTWAYQQSPQQVLAVYQLLSEPQKLARSPFTVDQSRVLMAMPHEQAAAMQQQSTPSMPPPGSVQAIREFANHNASMRADSFGAVLANIHLTGGAVVSAKKAAKPPEGLHRVSLLPPPADKEQKQPPLEQSSGLI